MLETNNFEQESGRSMVEMLGVLAIIGVLSVGGISGYTTAMNKHKANEILNAAAVRAMAVSAQIQSGVDPSTATGSVTTEDVGSAQIGSASPVGTEQFKLVFTNDIDESICNQMKNIAGENSAVGVACDRLLYNNDMSTGVGSNTNPDNRKSDGTCKDDFDGADCDKCKDTTKVYTNGVCASTGPSCPPNSSSDKDAEGYAGGSFVVTSGSDKLTCYCRSNYKYASGACDTPMDDVCSNYEANECGRGRYCQFYPETCMDTTPTQGTCKDIADCGMHDLGTTGMMGSSYDGDCQPDWWTAHSICASVGKHIPTLDEVGCADSKYDTCTSNVLSLIRNKNKVHGEYNGFTYNFVTEDLTDGTGSCTAFYVGYAGLVYGDRRYDYSDFVCVD